MFILLLFTRFFVLGKVGALDDAIDDVVCDDAETEEDDKEDNVDHFVCRAEHSCRGVEVVDAMVKGRC